MSTKQIAGIVEAFYNGASIQILARERNVPETYIEDLIRAFVAGQRANNALALKIGRLVEAGDRLYRCAGCHDHMIGESEYVCRSAWTAAKE